MTKLLVLSKPGVACVPRWVSVLTPLGALAHVHIDSSEHELCEDWRILTSGRFYLLDKANFSHWFAAAMGTADRGLVAELLIANSMEREACEVLRCSPAAREYLLALPAHSFDQDSMDRERQSRAVEITMAVSSAEAAAMAVLEMAQDGEFVRAALTRDRHLRRAVLREWSGSTIEAQAIVAALAATMEEDA
jgi:hypothetical protein